MLYLNICKRSIWFALEVESELSLLQFDSWIPVKLDDFWLKNCYMKCPKIISYCTLLTGHSDLNEFDQKLKTYELQ